MIAAHTSYIQPKIDFKVRKSLLRCQITTTLASESLSASQCFVIGLEVKQGCEMVLIVSLGQGGQGTKGLTLWVGKGMQGHWNIIARLKSWTASLRLRNFCPLLG